MRKEHRTAEIVKMALVGVVAASAAAPEAQADSAVGTNAALGNQLIPDGRIFDETTTRLSNFWENSRSPTGLLYPRPPLLPGLVQNQSDPDWWSSAWAEVGVLGSSGKTG